MLLAVEGCQDHGGVLLAHVCGPCLQSLHSSSSLPPWLSLANALWLGPVPPQLTRLTIPEQFLITRKFPRVYVIKLFPKTQQGNPETMQHGLKGNVMTFELNMDKICEMVNGQLMPQSPNVLPSVLSVCYVGSSKLSPEALHTTF